MLNMTPSPSLQPIRGVTMPVTDDLIARFLEHAQTAPDKIAIITTEQSINYQQLYLDVLYWKSQLLDAMPQNNEHGQIAIICLERSPLLLTLLLAMQWLGIPYIPVDPTIPIKRLRSIIEDSQAQALIYDINKHPDFAPLPCTLLDVEQMASKPSPEHSVAPYRPKQTGTAYIIYTSGSTGKPKGVVISRQALHNCLASMSTYFLQEEHAIALAITTISFDISVLELYLPIWQQKTVFIANQMQHNNPISIIEMLINHPITFLQATPSFWSMLLHLEWESPKKLVAICGGEPLTPILAQRLLTKVTTLWNLYGPTEATVWCALKQILPNTPITIGRPIHNMEMRVMDSEQRILPPYVKGELFISGIGLAEGYINNPELTRNKFIHDPDALSGRLYQTGDLACTTAEGEFIIFGRTDNQIKLHGYRIELEEIEAQMQTFSGVQETAATIYHEQLVGYISLAPHASFVEPDFMQHLAKYLPEYMLPKRVILLKALPKTLSGKIDKNALPYPTTTTSIADQTSQLTPIHLSLSYIWTQELKLDTIGIHDNFFELGGHSLLAARIISKVVQEFGKKTNLNDIYQAPTIAQFAKIVEQAPSAEIHTLITPEHSLSLPLHDFQLLLWLSKFLVFSLKTPNIIWRKRVQGHLDKTALDLALQFVLQKQEIFSYHIHRFCPIQTRCTKQSLQYRQWIEQSLLHLPDAELETYLTQKCDALFHKKNWRIKRPWISAYLYYLNHEQVELQVCMSHLVTDEDSRSIFFNELSNAYLFFTQRGALHAYDSFQPYRYYVTHQHRITQQHSNTDAVFWANYLQDAGSFHFPQQYIMRNSEPITTQIPLSDSFVSILQKFCIQHHVTLNDVLCAAISLTLLQSCDNDMDCAPHKLVFNITKSTRDNPQYDHVISCFLRVEFIILELKAQSTLLSLAKQAQQSAHETADYQRASSLVKHAAIGKMQLCRVKNPLKKFFTHLALTLLSKWFPELNLDKNLFQACEINSTIDRTQQFLINVNMSNYFMMDNNKKSHPTLFGLPECAVPFHLCHMNLAKYLLDVFFHRSHDENIPLLIITANLTPEFQKRFGETLVSLIEHCL